jgi:hypothetical protein
MELKEEKKLAEVEKENLDINEEFEFMMPLNPTNKLKPFVDRYFLKYYRIFKNQSLSS